MEKKKYRSSILQNNIYLKRRRSKRPYRRVKFHIN